MCAVLCTVSAGYELASMPARLSAEWESTPGIDAEMKFVLNNGLRGRSLSPLCILESIPGIDSHFRIGLALATSVVGGLAHQAQTLLLI